MFDDVGSKFYFVWQWGFGLYVYFCLLMAGLYFKIYCKIQLEGIYFQFFKGDLKDVLQGAVGYNFNIFFCCFRKGIGFFLVLDGGVVNVQGVVYFENVGVLVFQVVVVLVYCIYDYVLDFFVINIGMEVVVYVKVVSYQVVFLNWAFKYDLYVLWGNIIGYCQGFVLGIICQYFLGGFWGKWVVLYFEDDL